MGAISDGFKSHPEYLTAAGKRSAHFSLAKRVTGSVVSFLEQGKGRTNSGAADAAEAGVHPHGQSGGPVATQGGDGATSPPTTFRAIPHPTKRGRWTLECAGPPPAFVTDPDCYREFGTEARAQAAAMRLNVALIIAGALR